MYFKKLLSTTLSILAVLAVSGTVYAATTTEVVSGDTAAGYNEPGWLFNRDTANATPYEFNTDQASIGEGSLYVEPLSSTEGARKFIGEHFLFAEMADLNSISYDFLIGSGGDASDENEFYMSVYANFGESDPGKFYDCRYSVVPSTGSTTDFTTVEFDPTLEYPVATRGSSPHDCPAAPADMDSVADEPGAIVRMFALNVGDTSLNDAGLDGYLDNVVVSVGDDTTIYDFEPELAPESKDDCKKGGWMAFNSPVFRNQGDCVSYLQSNGQSWQARNR